MLPKTIIKEQFPQVTKIVDSRETISITVTKADAQQGRKKDPEKCALARACVRQRIAEAAIIGLSYSYLINGDTAVRYKTSDGVAREITSFDRHQDFAPGTDYKLSRVAKSERLGKRIPSRQVSGPHNGKKLNEPVVIHHGKQHHTSDVRILRSKEKK